MNEKWLIKYLDEHHKTREEYNNIITENNAIQNQNMVQSNNFNQYENNNYNNNVYEQNTNWRNPAVNFTQQTLGNYINQNAVQQYSQQNQFINNSFAPPKINESNIQNTIENSNKNKIGSRSHSRNVSMNDINLHNKIESNVNLNQVNHNFSVPIDNLNNKSGEIHNNMIPPLKNHEDNNFSNFIPTNQSVNCPPFTFDNNNMHKEISNFNAPQNVPINNVGVNNNITTTDDLNYNKGYPTLESEFNFEENTNINNKAVNEPINVDQQMQMNSHVVMNNQINTNAAQEKTNSINHNNLHQANEISRRESDFDFDFNGYDKADTFKEIANKKGEDLFKNTNNNFDTEWDF